MSEDKMNPREQAVKAIREGGMVVVRVDGKDIMFNMENFNDLPPLEVFASGDTEAEAGAFAMLQKEKAELEKRLASMSAKTETKTDTEVETKTDTEVETKPETKVETKPKAEKDDK